MTWQWSRWVVGSGLAHAGLVGALCLLATTAERPLATLQVRLIQEGEPSAPRVAPTAPIVRQSARTGPELTERQPPRRIAPSPSPAPPASVERERPAPPPSPVHPPPPPPSAPEAPPAASAEPVGASAAMMGAGSPVEGGGARGAGGSGGEGAGATTGAAEFARGIGVLSGRGEGRGAAGAGDGGGGASGSGRGAGHGGGAGPGTGAGARSGAGTGAGPGAGVADLLRAMRRQIEQAKVYPEAARRRETEGTVELRFRIAPDGSVQAVEIVHSSGHAILDESAILTIRRAAPYPVLTGWIQIPLAYRLER